MIELLGDRFLLLAKNEDLYLTSPFHQALPRLSMISASIYHTNYSSLIILKIM